MKRNKHIGSTLDEFLRDEGVIDAFKARASAEVVAWLNGRQLVDIENAAAGKPMRKT